MLVFDGAGADERHGSLEVRFAADADALLERLAATHRETERVVLVSSDVTLRGTSGRQVANRSSAGFLLELDAVGHVEGKAAPLADRLDARTRERLERLRRGE